MGTAHPLVPRAVHWALRCIELYDAKPEFQHHRKHVWFLKIVSVLRFAIESFLESKFMPPMLQLHVAPFHFVPFGDRHVEREHKYFSDTIGVSRKDVRGTWFCSRRLRMGEERMFNDAVFSNKLAEYLMSLKDTKGGDQIISQRQPPN